MNKRTVRRVAAASQKLLQKERRISEVLRLPMIPRLSLLDEASATYITGDDRVHLNSGEETPDTPAR